MAELGKLGLEWEQTAVDSTTRAGYFPGAAPIRTKVLAERRSGRLLGAQIVGREGSAKRIDVFATAIWNGMAVDEMVNMDLSYAPPFSPVWDPVLIAVRKVAEQPALKDIRGDEIIPGPSVQTDDEIDTWIRGIAETIYHPVGTCKMGQAGDTMAVVDAELKVIGISCLRVVDASVMPTLVGGNTNAPTIMVAEKAADMILGKSAPAPLEVKVFEAA